MSQILKKSALFFFLILATWNLFTVMAPAQEHWLKNGSKFPPFQLPHLKTHSVEDVLPENKKPTLVHIFASW